MKQCIQCRQWKEEEEFPWRNRLLGRRYNTCKACKREYDNAWYQEHQEGRRKSAKDNLTERRQAAREFVFNYLSYHVCEVCAEYRPEMLQFDHVRGKKKANIADMVNQGASIEAIKDEISKCRVICANCHQLAERRRREG
jgi:hypothetical protein